MTRWLWTAADGSVTDLSGWGVGNYVVAEGTGGHLAPEYEFASEPFAGVEGETLQDVAARPAQPVLGLDMTASDPVELRARVRALTHALRPRAGIGSLQAVADDGTSRTLPCYYRRGIESGVLLVNRFRAVLQFWSPSPWWRGDPLTLDYGLAAPVAFFPIPPITLSSSTIQGARTVDLSGTDAPTYPVWSITGPGDQLTMTNRYTVRNPDGTLSAVSRQTVLNSSIGDGQLVVIDTRPGFQSVRRASLDADGSVVLGVSLFGALGSDPALWPLVDGVNEVTVLLSNAGAQSRVTLRAERLFSGAL